MPIKWYTLPTLFVDIDTGEEINPKDIIDYIKIGSDKKVSLNDTQKFGTIQHIVKLRIKYQLELWKKYITMK